MLPGIVEFIHKDMTFFENMRTKQGLPHNCKRSEELFVRPYAFLVIEVVSIDIRFKGISAELFLSAHTFLFSDLNYKT